MSSRNDPENSKFRANGNLVSADEISTSAQMFASTAGLPGGVGTDAGPIPTAATYGRCQRKAPELLQE